MGALTSIKNLFSSTESADTTTYRCTSCGHEFESAKDPERARCVECLERDVERVR